MSDLIERLKHADDEEEVWLMRPALIAEIERLREQNQRQADEIVFARERGIADEKRIAKLQAVVDAAITAIESLDDDALGYGYDQDRDIRWPLRDELLMNLRAALEGGDE